jgi:hypothetical protein
VGFVSDGKIILRTLILYELIRFRPVHGPLKIIKQPGNDYSLPPIDGNSIGLFPYPCFTQNIGQYFIGSINASAQSFEKPF